MRSKDPNEPLYNLTTEEKYELLILAAGTLEGTDDEKLAAGMTVLAKAGQKHNEGGVGAETVLYYRAVGGSHDVLVRSVRPCREDPAIRPFLEYLSKSLLETPSDA
jgi:hypothetical protein